MVVAAGQPQGVLWKGCLLLALWAGSVAQAATPSALNLAAADASCLVFQVGTYGFAAHMNNIVEGAVMTKNKNQYYVNDTSFVYKCKDDNAWTSLFSSNNPWPKVWPKEKVELKTDAGEPCVPVNYGFTHGISDFLPDDNEAFDKIGNALIEMWSFEPETQAFIEKHNAWMDQMIKPIIAIHVRGGDKAAEDKKFKWLHMGPSDYWMAMGKVFPELRGKSGTCLFIGDDYNELSQVAASVATFSRCTILMEVPPQYGKGGHDQKTFNELAPKCDLTRLLIADIEAMARADYFIGSYTSNVSRLTQLLRVHKYNRTKESGTDVLLRPWVATPFSHPHYQVGRK